MQVLLETLGPGLGETGLEIGVIALSDLLSLTSWWVWRWWLTTTLEQRRREINLSILYVIIIKFRSSLEKSQTKVVTLNKPRRMYGDVRGMMAFFFNPSSFFHVRLQALAGQEYVSQ